MKKLFLLPVFILLFSALFAQEAQDEQDPLQPAVNENAFLVQKEIAILPAAERDKDYGLQYACQAVRLSEQWFLTAAHCVYAACKGTKACDVEITLAEAELKAVARVSHSVTDKRVHIYNGFSPAQNRVSGLDVALIQMDKAATEFAYAKPDGQGGWVRISEAEFNRLLRRAPETKAQFSAMNPLFISSSSAPTSKLNATLAVPKIVDGNVAYLTGAKDNTYYVKELEHFVAPDFGVRKGNSGGGVFTTSGELVGIVSARIYNADGSASFYDEKGQLSLNLENASNYFLFAGFNGRTLNFINTRAGSVRTIDAVLNSLVTPVPEEQRNFKKIISLVNAVPLAL